MKNVNKLLILILVVSSTLFLTYCKKDDPKPPVPDFTFSGDNHPAPCEVIFSNLSTNANSYSWNFGDGTTSTEENTKHTYSEGGTYTVTLTANGDGGKQTINKTLRIKTQVPDADFTFSGDNYPAPCDITFINLSTFGTSYTWDFGDGSTSNDKNVTHTFLDGGIYDVKLTAIGEGGTNSITKEIEIAFPAPIADFGYSGNTNPAPCEISFYNYSTNATSFYWDFNDGATSTMQHPNHVFTGGGNYNVKLTATGPGGSGYFYKSINIQYQSSGTNVTYSNSTYTNIYVTLTGYTQMIPPGSEVTFYSVPGSSASYHAYTSGTTTSGTQVGVLIEWDYTITLTGETKYLNLIISDDYFFLYMQNDGSHSLTPIYVNYGDWYETVDYVALPNNGVQYKLGYYRAFYDTEVRAHYQDDPGSYTYWHNLNFPWTDNQSLVLHNTFKSLSGKDDLHTNGHVLEPLFPAETIRKRTEWNKNTVDVICN